LFFPPNMSIDLDFFFFIAIYSGASNSKSLFPIMIISQICRVVSVLITG
jgi:hypothetical protein